MSVYQLGETERLSAIITQESYVLLSKHPSLSEPWSNSSHLWAGVVTSGNEVPDGKEPELQYYGVRTMGFSIKAKGKQTLSQECLEPSVKRAFQARRAAVRTSHTVATAMPSVPKRGSTMSHHKCLYHLTSCL